MASGVIWGFGGGGTVSFGWGGVHRDCRCLACIIFPGGLWGWGAVSLDGMAPTRTVGSSASIILPCSTKIKKIFMMTCNNIFGFNPVGAPTCLHKQEVGKPSLNAAQPDAKAEGCVHDDPPRADKLRKGWSFRVGTWNIDSLTGRSGELVEALAERLSLIHI